MYTGEYATSIYVSIGVAVILAVVSTVPALTSGGTGGGSNSQVFRAKMGKELAHCEANQSGVDCACFAEKSAHVLTNTRPEVRGFSYAERETLARNQARTSC